MRKHVHHIWSADLKWGSKSFAVSTLGPPKWIRRQRPILALTEDRVIVSRGQDLQFHNFVFRAGQGHASGALVPGNALRVKTLSDPETPKLDITGMAAISSTGENSLSHLGRGTTLYLAREDGTVSRYHVSEPAPSDGREAKLNEPPTASLTGRYTLPAQSRGVPIKYMASPPLDTRSTSLLRSFFPLLTLSANGMVSLFNAKSPWTAPSSFSLPPGCNPWSAFLSLDSSSPFAAIGATNPFPLAIFPFENGLGRLSSHPIAVLGDGTNGAVRSPAAYAICRPPSEARGKVSYVWGSSDQIVVSGWHDGVVRVHDMRDSSRASQNGALSPLNPVLTLADQTNDAGAVYCIDMGGGSASHIVAGQAIHGCLSIWDVRSVPNRASHQTIRAQNGWSTFPPDSNWSPTYDLIVEGSRIWGAGQSGPFLFDFGSNPAARDDGTELRPATYEHNISGGVVIPPPARTHHGD